ncbi:MAG TPA: hypothetical protein VIK92_02590 [Thermaerobacter sp.]
MFRRPFQYPLAFLTALLTLAGLLVGSFFYQEQVKAAPLERDLATVPGVHSVHVERAGGQWLVRVELGGVELIPVTYRQLRELADRRLGSGQYALRLVDRRTPELQQAFYEMSYYLEEARARGNFAEAARRIEEKGRELGLERARLYVDPEYLYLELVDDGGALYHVQQLRPPGEVSAE